MSLWIELQSPRPLANTLHIRPMSQVTYSCESLHMDEQRQDNQLEPTYNSSVPIWDVNLRACWKQWTIEKGGRRGSGISVLMARHDDDDDNQETIILILVWISRVMLGILLWEQIQSKVIQEWSSWLVGWLVLFYGISTLFKSFNAKLNFKQFSLVWE